MTALPSNLPVDIQQKIYFFFIDLFAPKLLFKLHGSSRLQKWVPHSCLCQVEKGSHSFSIRSWLWTHNCPGHTPAYMQHCSPQLHLLRGWNVILHCHYISAPLTIDYVHFSISSPAVEMARSPHSTDKAEQKCPRPAGRRQWSQTHRGAEAKLARGETRSVYMVPYLPTSSMLEWTTKG